MEMNMQPDSTNTPALPELVRDRIAKARWAIDELNGCGVRRKHWTMHIPADPVRDHDVIFADLADSAEATLQALSEACKERDEALGRRGHTVDWYARHYGKLEDWARKRLPEPWRDEFFCCVANGSWGHADRGETYRAVGGFDVTPTNYFRMDTAEGQLIRDQTERAEKAEAELTEARTLLANQAAGMRRLIDLVRHQRGELFAEQLISAEELAALLADSESGQRVARLESYDAMREKIKSQAAEIATLREKDAPQKEHSFSAPGGELDEFFVSDAHVHVERMDSACFWIGINGKGVSPISIRTGFEDGVWFFNVEEDSLEASAKSFYERREFSAPAPPTPGTN